MNMNEEPGWTLLKMSDIGKNKIEDGVILNYSLASKDIGMVMMMLTELIYQVSPHAKIEIQKDNKIYNGISKCIFKVEIKK